MKSCTGSAKTVCTDDIKFRQYRLFFSEKVYRADFLCFANHVKNQTVHVLFLPFTKRSVMMHLSKKRKKNCVFLKNTGEERKRGKTTYAENQQTDSGASGKGLCDGL